MFDELDVAIDDIIDMTDGDIDEFFKDKYFEVLENPFDEEPDDKKDENTETDEKGSKIDSEQLSSF